MSRVSISDSRSPLGRKASGKATGGMRRQWVFIGALSVALVTGGGADVLADSPGRDGALTVTAANTVVNGYSKFRNTYPVLAGATQIRVVSTGDLTCLGCGALAAGDLLLIYQPQGAAIGTTDASTYGAVTSLGNAGRYEFVNVVSTQSQGRINVSQCSTPTNVGLRYAYNDVAQVIRVPQYSSVTINPGASIVAPAWDGSVGGVVAMTVNGPVVNNGTIDVSGRGFRGAPKLTTAVADTCPADCVVTFRSTDTSGAEGAEKGEGIAGFTVFSSGDYRAYYNANNGRFGRGAPANAGGGGNSHNAGGGGGANGDSGATWSGYGLRPSGFDTTWALETSANSTPGPPANWTTLAAGGGRGGYSWSSNNVSPATNAPGASAWGGDQRREVGGRGGRPVTNNPVGGRAYFGGGGGAGHSNDNNGGAGGAGGGLVIVLSAGEVSGGSILANGAPGGGVPSSTSNNNDAPGGGGAGGTIILQAVTIRSTTLAANGGAGGNQVPTASPNLYEVEGPGGGGGGGYVATGGYVSAVTVSRQANGGTAGTTANAPLTAFPPNGATNGATGQATATFGPGLLPICTSLATLPVSLSWFHATPTTRGAILEWETSVEAGNVGFNVYEEIGGRKVLLNAELIPAKAMSRIETSAYSFETPSEGRRFWLEEVDVEGKTRFHGPFDRDSQAGDREPARRIDWESVRRESGEKQADRDVEAASLVQRLATRVSFVEKAQGPSVRLVVDREGIYRVTYEDLRASGFDFAGIPADSLLLTNRGVPVPTWVASAGSSKGEPGVFGPGSFLVFWGEGVRSLYTDRNVYQLTVARTDARSTMGVDTKGVGVGTSPATSFAETLSFDRSAGYSFASPTGDPWYETRLLAYTRPVQETYHIDLFDPAPGKGEARLDLRLWGGTDWPQAPDHHIVVRWNGRQVADRFADGIVDLPLSIDLGGDQIRSGANQLEVVLPGDSGVAYELVMVDTYAVTYQRQFRAREDRLAFNATAGTFAVEGFSTPDVYAFRKSTGTPGVERLAGVVTEAGVGGFRALFAGRAGKSPANDRYFVATGGAFLSPVVEPGRAPVDLARGERAQSLIVSHPDFLAGLEPLVADRRSRGISVRVVDVRDAYDLYSGGIVDPEAIRELVRHASRSWGTRSVLLVGGDTYDYFDVLRTGSKSFVPTLYAQTDPVVVRFAPADTLYGDVDGDGVPEVSVGRLPVRTSRELAVVVDKIVAWRGAEKLVLAADKSDPNLSFAELSDRIAADVPDGLPAARAYMDELGLDGARATLLPLMSEGSALVGYLGHSSYSRWSFAGLFKTADVATLTNAGRPVVVNQFGCWNNYFVEPAYDTLGHVLLLTADRGAVAALGTATLSDVSSDVLLGPVLTSKLLERGKSIGQALVEAKAEVNKVAPNRPDIQVGMTLLGDPELVLLP